MKKTHGHLSYPLTSHRFSMSPGSAFSYLAWNRLLAFGSTAILGIFFPLFLFEYFEGSLTWVLLWYLAMYIARLPIHIWAAKIFSKIGLTNSMVIGTFGAILFYLSDFFLDTGFFASTGFLMISALAGITILSGFYWTPFHVDFALSLKKGKQGSQISFLQSVEQIISVIFPILGGVIIAQYSYAGVFLFAMFLLLLSMIPLVKIPPVPVMYEFGFFETFKKLWQKDFRTITIPMIFSGAESFIGVVMWPLFLFMIFEGDYLDIGIFTALIVVVSLALDVFVGKLSDKGKERKILAWGSHIYAAGWVAKALVSSVIGIFAASTFHAFGSILLQIPFSTLFYEKAADSGHYVDEFTVVRETSLTIGRLGAVLVLLVMLSFLSLSTAFFLAALASVGMATIRKVHLRK